MEKELWEEVLKILAIDIPEENFGLWLKPIRPISFTDGKFKVAVPNSYFKEQIDSKYRAAIEKILCGLTNISVALEYGMDSSIKEGFIQKGGDKSKPKHSVIPPSLNPKYTFESFVIGENNSFAHAAAWAVAEKPGTAYNPLFIYGGVGLGKTHLMHAIGRHIFNLNPNTRIVYVTTEQFTYEFVDAIKEDGSLKFKDKYRGIDLLLVDDIQFLGGKEGTQDEFFHTFNALYELRKQIVLSSDRTPKEIPTVEERLRSRFESGLMVDIQPPNLETRIAILKRLAEKENIFISESIFYLIAEKIKANIRELEGAIIRIIAHSVLKNIEITEESVNKILEDIIEKKPTIISIDFIQKNVAKYFNIPQIELKSKKRNRAILLPRHIAMYLCRRLTKISLPDIGRDFGGKDHTTVIHACNKIEKEIKKDENLKKIIEILSTKF
ncbi:chromosomal replication initiator protein DnaA [bacterium]|nr:chromosomal replication initiator protein DnaA [bacterium]MBU2462278.1 chromosomal replication initiator protein DnaA [bacterium]